MKDFSTINAKLKHCPFCGGRAEVKTSGAVIWIECKDCQASAHYAYRDDDDDVSASEAAELWNRRTYP